MYKSLFIPASYVQVKTFAPIIKELRNCNVVLVSIDKYTRERAEEALQELNIPFRRMQEYDNENVREILRLESPDIVVIGNDTDPVPRLFVDAAKAMNIPTLLVPGAILFGRESINYRIMRGTILKKLKFWFSSIFDTFIMREYTLQQKLEILLFHLKDRITGRPNFYGNSGCSKIAAMGKDMKNLLIAEGVDPKTIIVTGLAGFDSLFEKFDDRIYNELNLDKNKKTILLATSNLVEVGIWGKRDRALFVSSIIRSVNKVPNCQLIIKLHPKEDIKDYQKILEMEDDDKTMICRDVHLSKLLKACDIALTTAISTVALQAIIANKLTIIINFTFDLHETPFVKSGVAIGIDKPENIVPMLEKTLYDPKIRKELEENRKKFVYEYAYLQDGQAARRVADLIMQMIEGIEEG